MLEHRIRNFIAERFLFDKDAEIGSEQPLLASGVLDSTGAMELVLFIEEEFEVTVADDELVPDNLDSIARIAAFVTRKRGTPASAAPSAACAAPSGGNGASDADAR
ncbi:MAG: hypothetical protein RI967_1016 [Planctomycetota bacterium]|jgi:acyl carrier protein